MNPDDISEPHHNGRLAFITDRTWQSYYETEKCLGAGGQGQIELAKVRATGQLVVVKRLMLQPCAKLQDIPELRMLQRVGSMCGKGHQNILSFLQIWNTNSQPGECAASRIILPYVSGGDLQQLRKGFDRMAVKVPEAFIWHAFKQMAAGFSFLHESGITHHDIKPQNIMVDYPPFGDPSLFPTIKIIDFGIADEITGDNENFNGTPKWQAPEAPILSAKSDVWSIGATIHFLASGYATKLDHPPNMGHDKVTDWYRDQPVYVRRISNADWDTGSMTLAEAREETFSDETPLPSKGYSVLLEHFMNRALDKNPSTRITSTSLNANISGDADKQIEYYKAYFRKCLADGSQRPMLTFAMIEPPPGWTPSTKN